MQPKHEVIGNKNFNKDLEYCTCIKFYIVSLIFHPLPSMRACPFEFSLWQMHWFLMRLLPQFQFWCVRKPLYGLRNTVALLLAWLSSYWGRSALYFLVPSGASWHRAVCTSFLILPPCTRHPSQLNMTTFACAASFCSWSWQRVNPAVSYTTPVFIFSINTNKPLSFLSKQKTAILNLPLTSQQKTEICSNDNLKLLKLISPTASSRVLGQIILVLVYIIYH